VWNDAALLNRLAGVLVFGAFCAFAFAAIRWSAARPAFAIQRVVVNGAIKHAEPAHIAAVIQQAFRGTFFTIDLAAARDALTQVPWLKTAAIRRRWPATLEVDLAEHQPLARWNDDALVSTEGQVFDAEYGEDLPDFYGTDGTAAEMTQRFREFSASLKSRRASIEMLSRSARGAWDVRLADGLTVALGRELVAERWARWVQLADRYGAGIAQGGQLVAVDLRYANGFAARITGLKDEAAGAAKARAAAKGVAAVTTKPAAKSGAPRVR
jgi:cell division protein FtsQ